MGTSVDFSQVGTASFRVYSDRDGKVTLHINYDATISANGTTMPGIVTEGTTSGEEMHKARHTAGQRVLDKTRNVKAVQKLLWHTSIQTTGDLYVDWGIDQLTATMADVLADDDE